MDGERVIPTQDISMKRMLLCCCLMACASAGAQEQPRLDYGVVAEVVRTMTTERNGAEILSSTNLMENYRDLAVQQALAREAARRGLAEQMAVQRALEVARRNVLIAALRGEIAAQVPRPGREQAEGGLQREHQQLDSAGGFPPGRVPGGPGTRRKRWRWRAAWPPGSRSRTRNWRICRRCGSSARRTRCGWAPATCPARCGPASAP
jgi:hypothetical protein